MSSTRPYKLDRVAIRMVKEPPLYSSEPLRSPEAAVKVIADMLRQYDREAFCIVNLRNDLSPINMNIVSTGTLNASLAHPREILKSAVLSNASATMLFHLCEASHKWNYAKCFFMRSFSLDPAESLVFKGDIASHKTVTDSYVAIGSSPPSVYRNTASLTQELGCS